MYLDLQQIVIFLTLFEMPLLVNAWPELQIHCVSLHVALEDELGCDVTVVYHGCPAVQCLR